jgi:HK97 family phage major capsid protein
MSDLTEVTAAIEKGNTAFEAFKTANDARLAKLEKGEAQSDQMAVMVKAFDEVTATQKSVRELIENMEAKGRRLNIGAGGASVKEADVEEHTKAFGGYMRKGTDFDKGLEVKALAISTNSGADGGYAVPKVIENEIEALVVNISPIRGIAKVVQIGTSDYHKLVNTRGTSSGWVGETAARPATSTPTLVDIKPPMGELYANPQATQQMLDDVYFNAESWLAGEVATEFARAEGAGFISGSGTNQPSGFLTPTYVATADGARAFGSCQYIPTGVAGAFAASNPADLFFTVASSLKKGYRQGAKWVTNKGALFTIAAFKDSTGRYIFNPVAAPDVPMNILGWEVIEAEDMPTVAANSLSISFGNFQHGYLIVDRIGTRIIRDPFSNKPYIGFYTTKRVGGTVINSEAIKAVKFSVS